MTADLPTLLTRVEGGSGPDRELDAEIMFDLFARPAGRRDEDGGPSGYLWPEDNPSWVFGLRFPGKDRAWALRSRARCDGETLAFERDGALILMNSLRVTKLTASLEAVQALASRFGFHLNLEPRFHIDGERVDHIARALRPRWADWRPDDEWFDRGEARHVDQVRAALAALLRALIDQTQEGKG